MKLTKLVEMAENITTFSDAWDFGETLYESKKHLVDVVKVPSGWVANVIKETVQLKGKEVVYKRSFVLKVTGESMTDAMKKAYLSYLGAKK